MIMNWKQFLNENFKDEKIIDFILDKINKYGIESLSKHDKDVLNGIYQNKKTNVNQIENDIFILLCSDEEEENILMDIENDYDIHSYYIIPLYNYCKKVYKNIERLFDTLEESPTVLDFFKTYVSYNTDRFFNTFNSNEWIITKSFKESFENDDIYFEEDDDFDKIKQNIINCFNI